MSRKRKGKRTDRERTDRDGSRGEGGESARSPSSPVAGKEAEPAKTEPRRLSTYDHVRENLEALIVAIILAVIIRQFAVEAFEIPTGSMAPTLYGIHAWTDCPNCDTDFNIALRTDSDTGKISVQYAPALIYEGPCKNPAGCGMDRHFQSSLGGALTRGGTIRCTACEYEFRGNADGYRQANVHPYTSRCPTCSFTFEDIVESTNVTGGHKILVTKFAYAVGEPQRWDVIVFTFDQWKNYIKRLVGKPGERIDIWNGNVYVDGEIERKYRHPYIQDVLWVQIADSTVPERGLRGHPGAWKELPAKGAGREAVQNMLTSWNEATRRWSVNAEGETAILDYQRDFDNYYHYNLLTSGPRGYPPSVEVGDRKVEFVVNPVESPATRQVDGVWIGGEIRDGDFTFQFRIPVVDGAASGAGPSSGEEAVLRRTTTDTSEFPDPDRPAYASPALEATAPVVIRRDAATRIAFENLDGRAAVHVDGELVLQLEYTILPEETNFADTRRRPPMPSEMRGAHTLRLLVANSQVELSEIIVFRDMYYIGDFNSSVSLRSSSIQLGEGEYFALGDNGPSSADGRFWGYVPESHLMGKAFAVFWPAWPTNFQCKFIR